MARRLTRDDRALHRQRPQASVELLPQWAEDPDPADEEARAEFERLLRERRLSVRANRQPRHSGEKNVC